MTKIFTRLLKPAENEPQCEYGAIPCSEMGYDCCNCGDRDDGCGCAYCWTCKACETCYNAD